jgi:hypothetical protein
MAGEHSRTPQRADLDAALRQLLDSMAAERVPARIMSVVDQLDEGRRFAPTLHRRERP